MNERRNHYVKYFIYHETKWKTQNLHWNTLKWKTNSVSLSILFLARNRKQSLTILFNKRKKKYCVNHFVYHKMKRNTNSLTALILYYIYIDMMIFIRLNYASSTVSCTNGWIFIFISSIFNFWLLTFYMWKEL
jgi:hypothetical protein